MQTIIIRLDPAKLSNPDLDLRYCVSERIEQLSGGIITDNGYDYLPDNSLGLWLACESAGNSLPTILEIIKTEQFLGNDLSLSAEIYISEKDCDEFENCTRVFPSEKE